MNKHYCMVGSLPHLNINLGNKHCRDHRIEDKGDCCMFEVEIHSNFIYVEKF